jgi:rSAM/selenodomain-associated transferase 1
MAEKNLSIFPRSNILLLFTRFPDPGKVKTRLIQALGSTGACNLHRRLTSHMIHIAKHFAMASNRDFVVCFDGADTYKMQQVFGTDLEFFPQCEGDLGQRMSAAFATFLGQGRQRVILIGSDCPGITSKTLASAFFQLNHHDLVLGPATDGGYYLIGMAAFYQELFQDIPWGTAEVLAKTTIEAAHLGLNTAFLEPLTDIDRPEDLPVLKQFPQLSSHDSKNLHRHSDSE